MILNSCIGVQFYATLPLNEFEVLCLITEAPGALVLGHTLGQYSMSWVIHLTWVILSMGSWREALKTYNSFSPSRWFTALFLSRIWGECEYRNNLFSHYRFKPLEGQCYIKTPKKIPSQTQIVKYIFCKFLFNCWQQ